MIQVVDEQYLDLTDRILTEGNVKDDRTGTGTVSVFGHQMRFDLKDGFPILTTKKVPFRLIRDELFWFLRGETNIKPLVDKNVNIWNGDAYRAYVNKSKEKGMFPVSEEEFIRTIKKLDPDHDFVKEYGDLGNIYGKQWRAWETSRGEFIDQLQDVIEQINSNPDSRRLLVTAWNPEDIHPERAALPPCHVLFQFYVAEGELSLQLYQRSGDIFLGVPFNISSYSLLLHIVAHLTNLEVGEFIHTLGDAHIYNNHLPQVIKQRQRQPRELPNLEILNVKKYHRSIEDFDEDSFMLTGYRPHPSIKGVLST